MRIFISTLLLMCFSLLGTAQTIEYSSDKVTRVSISKNKKSRIKTISSGGFHSGGFGALSFKKSEFKDKALVMTGLRGGWIINRAVAIGIEGYGIVPASEYANINFQRNVRLLGGYGGMFVEPILFSNEVVHVTFPMAGGAGWLGYHEDWEEDYDGDDLIDDDVFWYIEPGVTAEVNVSRHFRIAAGVTKRFTQDLNLMSTNDSEFENLNYMLTLKFGAF
ncbi:hypothetical protein [Fulvivirga ligni]|uniref:hypothetical protein n=1 Tax=Fulvivirga ligni TaxID=2904246 RepID=UPI001F4250CE|nr:hypothetical protein [Fulvivirga ligni]UII22807.1 hypothetical protein LVD16_06160 [Fulvivirga ligni]